MKSPQARYPRSVLLSKELEGEWKRHKRQHPKLSFNALVQDLLIQFFRMQALKAVKQSEGQKEET